MNRKLFYRMQLSLSLVLVLSAVASSQTVTQGSDAGSKKWLKPDAACGPRSLSAFVQVVDPNHHIKQIYRLIGKKPFAPTTLRDLKVAAEKLGFSAEGYKLTLDQLKDINTYAILPVGQATGTAEEPLHFMLLKEVKGDFATLVNPTNLEQIDIPFVDLKRMWTSRALLLSTGKDVPWFREKPDKSSSQPRHRFEDFDGFKDFKGVDTGSAPEHEFVIRNETDSPCKLRIVGRSCTCLSAEIAKAALQGGEETSLKLKLRVAGPGWAVAMAAVALEPPGIVKRYAVRGYGKDTFDMTPPNGHIVAPLGGVVEYPVRITYYTDINDLVTFDGIKGDISGLTVGRLALKKVQEAEYSQFHFTLPLLYDAGELGDTMRTVQGQVEFVLNTPKGPRFIPLKLTIKVGKEKFRLIPEKVFIIASKSGRPVQKKAKLELLIDEPPAEITLKSDPALPFETKTTRVSKNSYMVEITLNPEKLQVLPAGMHKAEIAITAEGGRSDLGPIILPISLFVRE